MSRALYITTYTQEPPLHTRPTFTPTHTNDAVVVRTGDVILHVAMQAHGLLLVLHSRLCPCQGCTYVLHGFLSFTAIVNINIILTHPSDTDVHEYIYIYIYISILVYPLIMPIHVSSSTYLTICNPY